MTTECMDCGNPVNPYDRSTYARQVMWVPGTRGNAVREVTPEAHLCTPCAVKRGIIPGRE